MSKLLERTASAVALLCLSNSGVLLAEDTLPEVQVKAVASSVEQEASEKTKSYTVKSSATATKLNTSLRETPQSISTISRTQLDDFRITNINDAFDYLPGVRVERVETDRTYYTARGADITNFQIDGIGVPMVFGNQPGDLDLAIYDRVEALRGANGLLSGTGNPSATINFVRKRPTTTFQAKIDASVGSWDNRRLDFDISGPINEAGNVRGRIVTVHQNKNSYLDRYSNEKNVFYGIIEADITDNTRLSLGHTYHQNDSNGTIWGALQLDTMAGTRNHFRRSDSSSPGWTYFNNTKNVTFAEIEHVFNNSWKIKAALTRQENNGKSKLFYNYEVADDPANNVVGGLYGLPGYFRDTEKDLIADIYASGPFNLGGREHEVVIGTNWSRTTMDQNGLYASYYQQLLANGFNSIPGFAKPTFDSFNRFAAFDIKRWNNYAATKLTISDEVKVTLGANAVRYESTGESYGAAYATSVRDKVSPYLGAVYKLDDVHSLYASYTEIFNPQVNLGADLKPLAPLEGKNYEIGIKSEFFDKKLNSSLALFKSKQQNVAQIVGYNANNIAINEGIDANTKGIDFDIAGEMLENLQINAGFTYLFSIKNNDGDNVKTYTPRRNAVLSTTYKIPTVEGLKVGASVRWQSDIHEDNYIRLRQESYAVVNLMASYDINRNWSTALNVYNLTNEKYLNSLYWTQSYYGAPRNAMLTLTWKY